MTARPAIRPQFRAAWHAVRCLLTAVAGATLAVTAAWAQDAPISEARVFAPVPVPTDGVVITEPFLDVRTGPGRGYPVTFVVARGEWVRIVLRRTDWFRVRTADGREGWVHRGQLDQALAGGGPQRTWRDRVVDHALARRVEVGMDLGRFRSDPMAKLWAGVRLTDTLSVVGTIGHLHGGFAGGEFKTLALQSEPWAGARWSPWFAIGGGSVSGYPRSPELQDGVTFNGTVAHATVGLRYSLGENFLVRAEFSLHQVYLGSTRIREYTAPALGLAYQF